MKNFGNGNHRTTDPREAFEEEKILLEEMDQ